jgi:hypothetical protein
MNASCGNGFAGCASQTQPLSQKQIWADLVRCPVQRRMSRMRQRSSIGLAALTSGKSPETRPVLFV